MNFSLEVVGEVALGVVSVLIIVAILGHNIVLEVHDQLMWVVVLTLLFLSVLLGLLLFLASVVHDVVFTEVVVVEIVVCQIVSVATMAEARTVSVIIY